MRERPGPALILAAASVLGALPAQADRILGAVRDGAGAPLEGAVVRILPASAARTWQSARRGPATEVRTDGRGHFSYPTTAAVALWIAGEGCSVVVPAATPGVPVVATVPRCAAVDLGKGAEGAWVRVDGVPLGYVAGRRLQLPGGRFELLVEGSGGPFLAGGTLRPGAEHTPRRPAVRPAELAGVEQGTTAVVLPWTARELAPVGGRIVLPASDAPLRVLLRTTTHAGRAFDAVWLEPGVARRWEPEPITWTRLVVRDAADRPVAGATLSTLYDDTGQPVLAGADRTDEGGVGHVRRAERTRVVVAAGGFAPAVAQPEQDAVVRLQPAATVRLRLVDTRGLPVAGARVRTDIDPLLDQEVPSDDRGGVVLRGVPPTPLRVRVVHDEFLPLDSKVDPSAGATVQLVLRAGAALRGRITCDEPARVRGVLVEVRDPGGTTGLEPRRTCTDASGRFSFRGLPDGELTLFARCSDGGLTWSGRLAPVRPGEGEVVIDIECDDPQPVPKHRGPGRDVPGGTSR